MKIGNRNFPRREFSHHRRNAAFTLLEILVVLAIIGMVTGVILVGVNSMRISGSQPSTPREVFWAAATAARKQALLSGREARLAYIPSNNDNGQTTAPALVVSWDPPLATISSTTSTTNPVAPPSVSANAAAQNQNRSTPPAITPEPGLSRIFPFEKMGDVICEFLSTQKAASSIMVGGQGVETQTIPVVTFFGDGTSIPFRVQLRIGPSTLKIEIDPWTCAEMLPSKTEGAQ